jgi:membrane-bound lytic murein transglycosylase D
MTAMGRNVTSRRSWRWFAACAFAVVATRAPAADSQPAPAAGQGEGIDTDALYEVGRQLFDQYAPPEVKAEYEFPSKQEWDAFAARLQQALQSDSPGALKDLAPYVPQARAALLMLRNTGAEPDLADWLEQRLDEIDAAQQIRPPSAPSAPPAPPAPPTATPGPVPGVPPKPTPLPTPAPKPGPAIAPTPKPAAMPYYDLWLARVKDRPVPERAASLMPTLRAAFEAEGVPASLAWLAEAESSMNPNARSPAGARGLFQLMPDTAKRLGLATFLPDERTDPQKSARAAARHLRELRDKFGSWPLALAAYNAGEGRVSRTLASARTKDYAAIANSLPAETRMYVPKVCALVAVRGGTSIAGF